MKTCIVFGELKYGSDLILREIKMSPRDTFNLFGGQELLASVRVGNILGIRRNKENREVPFMAKNMISVRKNVPEKDLILMYRVLGIQNELGELETSPRST